MGVFENIKHFFNRSTTVVVNGSISDSAVLISSSWQKEYAEGIVCQILSTALTNVRWTTFVNGKPKMGDEYFRFNFAPNKKETAPEFYGKLADKLIRKREALIIELADHQLFVADSYAFATGSEQILKENTFINVTFGDMVLNKQFKENRNCMYIKMPAHKNIDTSLASMEYEFTGMKELINKGADKAMGTKLNLQTNATGKNATDADYLAKLQEAYMPLLEKPNAVFLTQKGEQLLDLTEKQRGSEVEQVLQVVTNNITINHEMCNQVGASYGVPNVFMLGNFGQENSEQVDLLMTFFVKPILTLISKKFTVYALEKESILNGGKIIAELDTVQFVDALKSADSIDKLVSSGAYLTNEVRAKLGDGPIEGGDKRLITKNYGSIETVLEGGE